METKVVLEGITVGGKLLREHFEALDKAHVTGDVRDFMVLVTDSVREGFAPYWHVLGLEG
jgi:hypothetical protein